MVALSEFRSLLSIGARRDGNRVLDHDVAETDSRPLEHEFAERQHAQQMAFVIHYVDVRQILQFLVHLADAFDRFAGGHPDRQ